MKIGFLTEALPYLPSRGGFRLYGANLLRHLSKRHQIDLVSFLVEDDEGHLDWPRPYCSSMVTLRLNGTNKFLSALNFGCSVLWARPFYKRRELAEILWPRSGGWDVIHVEGSYVGSLIPPELPIAKVLSLHDSWTLRCEEMLKCSQSLREKLYYTLLRFHAPRWERMVYPRFERCVVVADRDVQAVQKIASGAKVGLIPYGTDTEYFHPVPVEKRKTTLVFHSHLGYAPNIEAALEFADAVFPLIRREVPDAIFHLVGADPAPKIKALASRPGIRISANLPDLREAVCSASIYVCAIRHGTGLKSKVLEAMGMRMPIVCYPGSTVGIDCVPGQHLLVAQNPQEFAAHVLDLLRNPDRAGQIARAGRRLVEEKYSWESRARAFEQLYGEVIEEHNGRVNRSGQQY